MTDNTNSRRNDRAADESGVSLIELMVAMGVFLAVITMVLAAVGVMTKDTIAAQTRGTDIDQATVGVNRLAAIVENAYWPFDAFIWGSATPTPQYTSDCSGPPSGGVYSSFPILQGPVDSEASQDLVICSLGTSSSNTAYTDEIKLVNSSGGTCTTGVCTLVVDQWPAAGQSGNPTQIFSLPGVDASGTSFSYLTESGGTWASTSTPASTYGIDITVRVDNGRGQSSPVTRTVAMPNYGSFTL